MKIKDLLFYISLIILCIFMIFFMNKKHGFHADEMFSYGSSNYKYDNVFQPYGDRDYINKFINDNVKSIKDIIYYVYNVQIFINDIEKEKNEEVPIWKTKDDALKYVTLQSDEILNFFSVYYNQSRDTHPPLFYYLVHIVSIIFLNHFSKYTIFIINMIAFIGVNIIIKKMLNLIHKEHLTIPTMILYGLSIGAISTVMFQRMYMLLTFFIIFYSYLCIKIIKNDFKLSKELRLKMGIIIILGFLTHYYFCIYAIFFAFFLGIKTYKKYGKKEFNKLIFYYCKIAIIGVLLFPASIYHIFFSYRGIGATTDNFSILDFFYLVCDAYSLNLILGLVLFVLISIIAIIKCKKKKDAINLVLLIPTIGFIIICSKISPYLEMRYIMGILPIVAVIFWISIDDIFKSYKKQILSIIFILIIIFSIVKLSYREPLYLYSEYEKNIEIAKENYNKKFIYIGDNAYNHIQNMPEFMIYEKSLILNVNNNELKYLESNNELIGEDSFIVSMKQYMNVQEIIEEVKSLTGYDNYNTLLNGEENIIFEFYEQENLQKSN